MGIFSFVFFRLTCVHVNLVNLMKMFEIMFKVTHIKIIVVCAGSFLKRNEMLQGSTNGFKD
jgi:hypothetical protein